MIARNMLSQLSKSSFNAIPSQKKRLRERHEAKTLEIEVCDLKIRVLGGVYKTSADTVLMAESVRIGKKQTFLEIGCGAGVVSIILGTQAKSGIGVDVNPIAVQNSRFNATRHRIKNVQFFESDLFYSVNGKFDVIVCNPPYSDHPAGDAIEKMFWDEHNEMKKRFFKEVSQYLKPKGHIYFGWADFADLDINLPLRLAQKAGLKLLDSKSKPSPRKNCIVYVLEFAECR